MLGGGLYSLDFAIDVAFSKYGPHQPLEWKARWMMQQRVGHEKLDALRQIEKLAGVLSLSYDVVRPYVLSSEVLHGRPDALAHAQACADSGPGVLRVHIGVLD